MSLEMKLRKLQDGIRDRGWRIKHVSWLPEGKLEYYGPNNISTWLLVIFGLLCFLGGPVLSSKLSLPVWGVIALMVFGLVLLMLSRYAAGHFLYSRFVSVEALCVDKEIREFICPDSAGSLTESTFWVPRILCNFEFRNQSFRVTPIIVKTVAFSSKKGADHFLEKRMDANGKCRLWIDPDNPLHAVFHKKPVTGPYTV